MLEFLSDSIKNAINRIDSRRLVEIRLRVNLPVYVSLDGHYHKLNCGNYVFDEAELEKTLIRLTDRTFYAHNDTIKRGYIVGKCGERVGLCGNVVFGEDGVKTVKAITSLCIRVPREIIGCADEIFKKTRLAERLGVLIVSPPLGGKTTMLRDIARTLSVEKSYNVLVIDDRFEISRCQTERGLGETVDVFLGASKLYGLSCGVATLRPDYIIVDELRETGEIDAVINAAYSGVTVVATAHADSLDRLSGRDGFDRLISSGAFDSVVVLSDKTIGKIKEIISLKNGN